MDENILINPTHPLTAAMKSNGVDTEAVKQFITTYGPYITIALFLYKMYGNYKLNKTLTTILKKLN